MNDNIKIIGLTGKARSGKDTAARFIKDWVLERNDLVPHEESWVVGIESFAAPIKHMVAQLLDFFGLGSITVPGSLEPYIDGDLKEVFIPEIGASPRTMMQTLGTEWGRNIDPNIWINCMQARIKQSDEIPKHGYKGAVIIIPDVRFDNEAQFIHEVGGKIIEIDRNSVPEVVGASPHESEAGIDVRHLDGAVWNNDTLEHYNVKVLYMVNSLALVPPWPNEEEIQRMFQQHDYQLEEDFPINYIEFSTEEPQELHDDLRKLQA